MAVREQDDSGATAVPAAERALDVLEALAAEPQGLAAGELVARVDMSRSGLYALLGTLRARGYVRQDDQRGAYRLGPALTALLPTSQDAHAMLLDAFHAELAARPPVETTACVVVDAGATVVLAEVAAGASRTVRAVYPVGTRRGNEGADALVLRAGAVGRGADEAVDPVVRRDGRAVTRDDDVVEIAAPVCPDGVRPTAAIMVGVPRDRAGDEVEQRLAAALGETAARLSYRLGAASYRPYGWTTARVGPSKDLPDDELTALLTGVSGAQLAVVRPDGTPHVVPIWFEWDGTAVWLAASPGASWAAAALERARASVTVDEPWPPLRRAFLSGELEPVAAADVPGGIAGLRRRMAVRYLGSGGDALPELCDVDGWSAFRLVPERIRGAQGLGLPA